MGSALSIPAAEKFFDGLQSADVKITDWDYPKATLQAVIQTYRSDFFEDFTLSDAFKESLCTICLFPVIKQISGSLR